jgi:ribonucleotide reductase alpha subunit
VEHNIFKIFAEKNLFNIKFATEKESLEEHWNVSGILKKHSNQEFKFDVRPMFNMPNNQLGKKGTTASKADKIVFETDKEWVIIDIPELHEYVKKQISKTIQFEDLLNKLEWNIVLPKK